MSAPVELLTYTKRESSEGLMGVKPDVSLQSIGGCSLAELLLASELLLDELLDELLEDRLALVLETALLIVELLDKVGDDSLPSLEATDDKEAWDDDVSWDDEA